MSVYVVATITIHDRKRYAQYEAGFLEIFARYQGEVAAVSDDAEMLEGEKNFTRLVLARFPDREALMAWYQSPEYQELAQHRFAASDAQVAVIPGFS